jgi:GTPase SAR1 family protein
MYIRDANIILVVYDITNKDTFVHTEHWVNETKDLKRDDAIFVLVGNKIDLEENRVVTRKEAEDFATEKGFLFHEVSAKTGDEIQELFNTIIFPEMAKKFKIGDEDEEANNEQGDKKADKVVLGQGEVQQKKGGCCGGGKNKQNKIEQSQGEQEEVN